MNQLKIKDEMTDFLLYRSPDGNIKVEVILGDESVWLSQKSIAQLFGVKVPAISKHLQNIYKEGELDKESTISIMETVGEEGNRQVKRKIEHYNLDTIISVGYRVNSKLATQFRIWATKILKEYILKGFALDDERLKNGNYFGKDYFRELLERVRSIRSSERRIYQQITDIFAECSIDYDPKSDITKDFYANIQNRFHFAIHGSTAAELIYQKADANKKYMGLTTWKNAPDGRILKMDARIAKNYLNEKQIRKLERTVSGFFDYIERIIENRNTFTMKQFSDSVNKFLEFNEFRLLEGKGLISARQAELKVEKEYSIFNKNQNIDSDFDKLIKQIKNSGKE